MHGRWWPEGFGAYRDGSPWCVICPPSTFFKNRFGPVVCFTCCAIPKEEQKSTVCARSGSEWEPNHQLKTYLCISRCELCHEKKTSIFMLYFYHEKITTKSRETSHAFWKPRFLSHAFCRGQPTLVLIETDCFLTLLLYKYRIYYKRTKSISFFHHPIEKNENPLLGANLICVEKRKQTHNL